MPTVSYINTESIDYSNFSDFIKYLKKAFPLVHKNLKLELINNYSLLYRWEGSTASSDKKPALLLAHYDVVPADTPIAEHGASPSWDYPPFSGAVEEGYIWGRGALDNKTSLIGILEAAEQLISAGFSPKRTIYIASGYDEEIGGKNGALKTAQELKQRGILLDFVLDEGFTIIEPDIFTLLNGPIALIGIAEKGIMDIMITADGEEGHASMPPKNTAAGKLAKAIVAVEKNPFPARIIPTMKSFLKAIAPEVKGITGFILRHSGIFEFLIKKSFALSPTNNAMIRTTQAVTMLKGSEKENVLPKKASAVINIRILPGDTTESVLERIKRIINDKSVKVEVPEYFDAGNPVDESNLKSEGYKIIEESIHETFPGIFTAPSIVLATTDSRHYKDVSENIFRFVPIRINKSNLKTIHGTNERIKEEDFLKVVDFYKNLINRL
ncbi:MAG: hypothetical protein DRP57_13825 [Spirochaetes bacterium]|nr:MAG: hypothetical protein DRP57_13825 [Spirochaetota bacterium]